MLNFNDTILYHNRITQIAMQVLTPNWNATDYKLMLWLLNVYCTYGFCVRRYG
jgi:hypothetical protein